MCCGAEGAGCGLCVWEEISSPSSRVPRHVRHSQPGGTVTPKIQASQCLIIILFMFLHVSCFYCSYCFSIFIYLYILYSPLYRALELIISISEMSDKSSRGFLLLHHVRL